MLLSWVPFGNKTSLPAFAFGNQWNEITLQRWISPSAPSFSHWSVWEFSRPTLSPGSYTLHTWLMMEMKTSIFRYQRRGKRPRLDTNRPLDQLRLSTPVGIFYFTFNPFSERKSETLCSVTVQSEYLECPIWILCVDAAALAKLDSGFTVDNAVLFYSWLLRKPFYGSQALPNVNGLLQCDGGSVHPVHLPHPPGFRPTVAEILMHWKPVASVVKVNLRLMSSKLAKTNLAHEPNDFSHLRSAFSSRRRAVPSLKPISCHLAPAC